RQPRLPRHLAEQPRLVERRMLRPLLPPRPEHLLEPRLELRKPLIGKRRRVLLNRELPRLLLRSLGFELGEQLVDLGVDRLLLDVMLRDRTRRTQLRPRILHTSIDTRISTDTGVEHRLAHLKLPSLVRKNRGRQSTRTARAEAHAGCDRN